MNKKITILAIILIALILTASAYATYNHFYLSTSLPSSTPSPIATSSPTPSPIATPTPNPTPSPTPVPTSVNVVDGNGDNLTIALPVTSIVSITATTTEMLCVMGLSSEIVGVDTSSITPPSLANVPVVTGPESDYEPNVEEIIQLNPSIIFADSMLPYNTAAYQQLEAAGIPIYIVDTTVDLPVNPSNMTAAQLYQMPTVVDFTCDLMQNLVQIFPSQQPQVTAYVNWAQSYNQLVKNRIAAMPISDEVSVFLDWYDYPYETFVTQAVYQAGGYNIAENQTVYSPVLSPEFVVAQNPTAIILMVDSPTHNINDFKAAINDVESYPELQNVTAIEDKNVYACDFDARSGVLAVIGYLAWAKWLQPSLFPDIDPDTVLLQLNEQFLNSTMPGTFVYPD